MAENENKELEKTSENEPKSDKETDDNQESLIPDEILEAIPVEERGKVISIIKQSMVSSITRRSNPIAEKITTEHITQLINKSDETDKRDRKERQGQRNHDLLLVIIGLIFIGFLIVFLQQDKDLLLKIVIAIISFVGGFGIGKSAKKKEE